MPQRTASEAVKLRNRADILKTIREQDPISRVEISRLLGLHPSTVSRLVDGLMALDLVREGTELEASTRRGGRRAIALEFNPGAGYLIGVDLGGTHMVGGLADLSGEIILQHSVQPELITIEDGEGNLRRLIELVQGLIAETPDPARIWGVGVGVPGVVTGDEGTVSLAPAVGWWDLPLKQIMERALGLPVFVENDVNLAAMGEYQHGAGQGIDDLVAVFIGTGIGAGVILNGELYQGANRAAGEVGYMVVDTSGLGQRYDEFGCLESLASGRGIAIRARERIAAGERTALLDLAGGDPAQLTAEMVFEAARGGDGVAQAIVEETIRYLSLLVTNVSCVLNPEMVVLGGGVARSADLLLDGIRKQVEGVVPVVPRLTVSTLGKDAIIHGAFAMVLRQVSEVDWRIP